ncbi:hypothetical protein DFH09DRAFT_925728, partial [Mycena vulgaris]
FLQFRLQYSSLALLYYDYAPTFPKELQFIWNQKLRLSTALYICCRYALIGNVLYLFAIADKLGSTSLNSIQFGLCRCDTWYKIVGGLSVLGRFGVIAVSVIRTYAACCMNKWVLAYMGTVGLVSIGLDITHVPGVRCVGSSALPMYLRSILIVIFEYSSAILTTVRCAMALRAAGALKNRRDTVTFILFEQGIVYFCTISIFTTAGVILNYLSRPTHRELPNLRYYCSPGFFQRLPNAFTLPLSGILTARFILYLREWDAGEIGVGAEGATKASRLEFRGASGTGLLSGIVDDFGVDLDTQAVAEHHEVIELELEARMEGNPGDCEGSGSSPPKLQLGLV